MTDEQGVPPPRADGVRKALGDNIRRIRGLRGITVREFSASLKDLGVALSPSGVSEIENASRKVSVEELLAIAIALNTNTIDLIMPPERVRLSVASGIDPLPGGWPLLWWLQGRRPWSQSVSAEDFTDAARHPHLVQLHNQDVAVIKAIDALESPVRLALTGLPRTGPLAPILRHALDRVVKEVDNIITSVESEDVQSDGG